MVFENDQLRIGPPSVDKERFLMPGRGGVMRKGKKFEIPEFLTNLGLNAYEFSAGRMANFADSPIYAKFRENVNKYNLAMSIHAPYYISLASEDNEIYQRSIERVANVFAWAVWLNAKRIVVHPGGYGKRKDLSKVIRQIIEGINAGIEKADEIFPKYKNQFKNICLCPETMGKHGQAGTIKEIIQICKACGLERVRPCVDFGHIFARNLGKIKGRKLYESVFEELEQELGSGIVQNLHIHFSHIIYTQKGEKEHVINSDTNWDPEIRPLFEIIKEQNLTPIIINESPDLEADAKILMDEWISISRG